MKVLIIEDDRLMAQTLRDELKKRYFVDIAYTFKQGDYLVQTNTYDVILLDLSLPDGTGTIICSNLRQMGINTPILILTGETNIKTKVSTLDLGADDYVLKPFSLDEIMARIRALIRREYSDQKSEILSVGDLTLNAMRRTVMRQMTHITLRRREFDILEFLVRNQGKVINRETLLDHIWEGSSDSLSNIIDVHINYLREKVDKPFERSLIKTVHGVGYKIEA